MNLQFVFGNPTKKNKVKDNKNKSSHGRTAVAKKRKKSKGAKKRNPEVFQIKTRTKDGVNKKGKTQYKTVKKSVSKRVISRGDMALYKAAKRVAMEKIRGKPKAFRVKIKKQIAKADKVFASEIATRSQLMTEIGLLKDQAKLGQKEFGDSVVTKAVYSTKATKRKKKKTKAKSKKRKSIRTKSAKKGSSKKKSKSTKRKKRSGARRVILARKGSKLMIQRSKGKGSPGIQVSANPGKKKKAKRTKTKRKSSRVRTLTAGKSFSLKSVNKKKKTASFKIKAKNPSGGVMNKVQQLSGYSDLKELGSLAFGGAVHSTVNKAAVKYLPGVMAFVHKTPGLNMIAPAVPSLAMGILLNFLGEKYKNEYAKLAGKGMIGSAVVGIGVVIGQKVNIPGLSGLDGVDYTMEGIGSDADFGYAALPEGMGDDADFGGVDYTMEGEDAQMGNYDGVDYTMEGYGDDADFGTIPEGLGQGQMG